MTVATKKNAGKNSKAAAADDPRQHIEPKPAALDRVAGEVKASLSKLKAPDEPVAGDLIAALMHIQVCKGLPCGIADVALDRFETQHVDRNEFRVTEAFETEELLADLDIPDLFARCREIQETIGQVYNDQNGVTVDFLREAAIADRKNFFARVPAVTPPIVRYLSQYVDFEEVLFSSKSTQRVQVRLGLDPKASAVTKFIDEMRAAFAPFGHIPLHIGPLASSGKPILDPVLCPACTLLRIAPSGKR